MGKLFSVAGGSYPTKMEILVIGSQAVMCGSGRVSATHANTYKEVIKKIRQTKEQINIYCMLTTHVQNGASKESRIEEKMDFNFYFIHLFLFLC